MHTQNIGASVNWCPLTSTFIDCGFLHLIIHFCAFIQGTAIRDRIQEQLKRQQLRGLLYDKEDDDDDDNDDYFYDDSTEEEEYYENEDEK